MILYHGSNRNFEKFDVKYINTGEGLQKFGYGFYFTDNIELADHYSLKWLYECDVYNTQKFVEWNSIIDDYSSVISRLKFLNKDSDAEELGLNIEDDDWTYRDLYEWLEHILGDKKYVSNFFEFIDIEGIIADDPLNRGKVYVVFDVRNIKIIDSWLRDEGKQFESISNKSTELKTAVIKITKTFNMDLKYYIQAVPFHATQSDKIYIKKRNGTFGSISTKNIEVLKTFNHTDEKGINDYIEKKRDEINNPKDIDIKKSYLNLIPEYISHFKLKNISDINNGLCEEIADDVIDMNGGETEYFYTINDGEFWDTEVTKYKTSEDGYYWQMDKIKKYGMPTFNLKFLSKFHLLGHTWIYYKGLHYDAETLDGVSNFWDLKIYQRQLAKLNININETYNPKIYQKHNNNIISDKTHAFLIDWSYNSEKLNYYRTYGISVIDPEIIKELSQWIPIEPIKLYRGICDIEGENNYENKLLSYTRDINLAQDLIQDLGSEGAYVKDGIFKTEQILVDITLIPNFGNLDLIDEVIVITDTNDIKKHVDILNESKINESDSDILTLYHGTDDKHQFDTHGYLVNGTFFSDQKKTAAKYGKYIYEVKFKDLNLMDLIYDKKHISELLKHFPVLEEEDYNLKVTTVEQFYELSDSWGIIESNKDVLEWIKGNYDGVKLLEGGMEHNILVFKPFKDKIVSSELVEDLNESITAYHGSTNNFKNFDFNYIKTMYYGWGLYFTDNKNIADGYGKEHGHTIEINGVDYQNDFISINKLGTTYDVKTLITDIKECIKSYERDIIRYPDNSSNTQLINLISQAKYILELLENSNGNYKVKNKNIVYQVDIFKNNTTLLKWNDDIDEKTLSLINIKIPKKYQTTGEIIYEYLCNRHFNRNKKETSLYLKSIGIDGIIVNHRDDNIYVVFDKDDINEVERLDESIKLKTQTKKWFGDSVITDDNGEPLVLYHGTSNVFNKFDIKRTTQGIIWFSTDKDKIEKGESGAAGSKIILECIIKANKVAGWEEYEKLMLGQIEELGYDAVKLDDDYFVFSDKQIKIIDWKFNSKNLKITYHGKLPSSDYKWLEIVGRRSYSGGELTPIIANDILVGGISWNLGGIDMIIFKQEFRNKGLLKHIVYDNVEKGVVKFVTASEELISKLKNYGEVTYDSDTDITSVHINKKMNESNYGNDVLDLPFVEGVPSEEKVKEIQKWLTKNTDKYNIKYVKLYHATNPNIDVLNQGLKPTSYTRRRSYQSTSGYVYLAATPERAKVFGDIGNGCDSTVYEVIIPIWKLKPDMDQLNNQKSVGKNVKNTVAYSLIYGGGVRYKGAIEPWQIRKVDNNISENYNTELENWFTGSKVVNEDGTPKVVYHGTAAEEDFTEFMGDRGIGWFTPNKEYAENYIRESGKLISIYLSIKNPYVLNVSPQVEMTIEDFIKETGIDIKKKYYGDEYKGEVRNVWDWYNPSLTNFFEKLEELGYDGIKTLEYDKYESWCPFDNSQIKKIEDNISTKISEHYKPTSNILINQNFKKWFNGSKVINENGTPKIVYHGMQSNEKFYVFDKKRQINGNHGKGFYFGDINYATSYYGDNYIACYLKITKLFDMYAEYDITEIKRIYGDYYNLVEDFIKKESEISYNGKIQGFVFYNYIGNINTLLISAGYDGIKHDFVYVVFEPNQIKLADGTNRTFNGNSDDIREAYVNSDGEYIDDVNTLIGQRYDAPYGFKCMNCDEETFNMLLDKWYSGDEYEYLTDEGDWKLYTYRSEIFSSDKKDLYWHTDNILKINSKDRIICTKEGDKIWDIKIRKSNLTAEQEMQIRFYEKDSKYYADRFIKLDYNNDGNPLIYLKTMDTKGVYKIEIYPDGTISDLIY